VTTALRPVTVESKEENGRRLQRFINAGHLDKKNGGMWTMRSETLDLLSWVKDFKIKANICVLWSHF
jgi:hypothetical protein